MLASKSVVKMVVCARLPHESFGVETCRALICFGTCRFDVVAWELGGMLSCACHSPVCFARPPFVTAGCVKGYQVSLLYRTGILKLEIRHMFNPLLRQPL
jgi:hypothetical protein